MRKNTKQLFWGITVILLIIRAIASIPVLTVYADTESNEPMIVVSLGDSYSSGEGIEPFYYQRTDKYFTEEDWLAHRSANSWPSKLVIPGYEGDSGSNTMGDYKYNLDDSSGYTKQSIDNNCTWYFVAASGATTDNINSEEQKKTVRFPDKDYVLESYLPKQLDVFQKIEGKVDYVTITIGGNDVEFAGIMTNAALHSNSIGYPELSIQLDRIERNIETYKAKLRKVYYDISKAAPEADIIVAGYPLLLDPLSVGTPFSPEEVELINKSVSRFNTAIKEVVKEWNTKGMKIHFVDVKDEFLTHGAYSKDPWINPVMLGPRAEDLDLKAFVSSYSLHPNEKGAEAYARCVNEKISKLEDEKKDKKTNNSQQSSTVDWNDNIGKSIISGKVVDSETEKPLNGVTIECRNLNYISSALENTVTDDNGYFKFEDLSKGSTTLIFSHEDYNMKTEIVEIASNSEEYDVGTIKMSKKGHEELPFREDYEGIPDLAVSSDDGYYVPEKENRTIVYYSKDRSTSKELDILVKSEGESVLLMQFYDGKLYVNGGVNFYIYDPKSDTVKIAGFPSENYSISHNEWMVYGEKIYYIDRTSSGSYMLKAADLDGDPLEESIDIKHSDKLPFTWAPVNFIIYDDSVYYVNNMPEGSQILKAPLDGREQEVIYTGKAGYTVDVCDIKDDYLAVLIYNHELGSDVIVLPLKQELGHPIQVVESADISTSKSIKLYNGMVLYTVFNDGLYKYNLQSGETQKVTDQFSVSFSIIDDYIYAMLPEVKYLWYSLKE